MEAMAKARFVRVTPLKARRVTDLIKGRSAVDALAVLKYAPQSASEPVYKLVASAIANARVKAEQSNQQFDERDLLIGEVFVDEGPTMKRFRPRAQGRAFRINKRTSHITVSVVLPDDESSAPKERRGVAAMGGSAAGRRPASRPATEKKPRQAKEATA